MTLGFLHLVLGLAAAPALAAGECTESKDGAAVAVARGLSAAGDSQGGLSCLAEAAEAGDGTAAWELAVLTGIMQGGVLAGNCPPFDLLPLARFYRKPFEHFPQALQFSSCPETRALALKALQLGAPDALFAAAWSAIYYPGNQTEGFTPPGDPWTAMVRAAEAESALAAYEMGLKAHFGPGGHASPQGRVFFDAGEWRYDRDSYDWMLKAAHAGHPPAMDAVGAAHCPGHVISTPFVEQDLTTAADWLEDAKDAGFGPADARLRRLLEKNGCG